MGSDLIPDFSITNDKYLVVVNYNACKDSNKEDADGDVVFLVVQTMK